jgi:hypothetical protein
LSIEFKNENMAKQNKNLISDSNYVDLHLNKNGNFKKDILDNLDQNEYIFSNNYSPQSNTCINQKIIYEDLNSVTSSDFEK